MASLFNIFLSLTFLSTALSSLKPYDSSISIRRDRKATIPLCPPGAQGIKSPPDNATIVRQGENLVDIEVVYCSNSGFKTLDGSVWLHDPGCINSGVLLAKDQKPVLIDDSGGYNYYQFNVTVGDLNGLASSIYSAVAFAFSGTDREEQRRRQGAADSHVLRDYNW